MGKDVELLKDYELLLVLGQWLDERPDALGWNIRKGRHGLRDLHIQLERLRRAEKLAEEIGSGLGATALQVIRSAENVDESSEQSSEERGDGEFGSGALEGLSGSGVEMPGTAGIRRRGIPPTVRDWIMETVLMIRSKEGRKRLKLNRTQQEYSLRCTKQNIVLKARQLGMTTYIAARFFVQAITRPGTVSLQVAHDQDAAEAIFRIVHRFWENLPRSMREGALVTSRANVRQIVFPMLDSEYRVTAADENAGRGLTLHNLHCSEVARWPRGGEETLASLRAAVVPGGEIVLESTPNGAWGVFYDEWMRASETGYTRHFFPWWYEPRYAIKPHPSLLPYKADEQRLADEHGLTQAQIQWRRAQWTAMKGLGPQEFAEDAVSCFRASGECVFELDAVDKAMQCSRDPVELRDNRRLMVWLPPQPGHEYIVGVDPAGGGAQGDYSCAQVMDRESGMQCAELHGHYPPRELANKLLELGREYNGALLAVESNNHGHGVLAHLKERQYPNMYFRRGQAGWVTNQVTRPAMLEALAEAVGQSPEKFTSPRLLNELRTFVRDGAGNTGAAAGSHDDCVMAMAISWAVRREVVGRHRGERMEWASVG